MLGTNCRINADGPKIDARSDGVDETEEVEVDIPAGPAGSLAARLTVPADPVAVVAFAHGRGSGGRSSPRDRFVAEAMHGVGLVTVLTDLVSTIEALVADEYVEVTLLARRLGLVREFVRDHPLTRNLPVAYFGGGTGAAAAIVAASGPDADIAAIVGRGGRIEHVSELGATPTAPTLLIVGSDDRDGLRQHRRLLDELTCERRLDVVVGASNLFEEPEALSTVASRACEWILEHLPAATGDPQNPES
jgi:putative phosphoribosyl transferase